ncbi:MAG: hypothetical protein AAGA93_18905 [Actinomycetota bacterium]
MVRATATSMGRDLAGLPASAWLRAPIYAVVAAVVIAIPADLIENPIFGRPIEPKAIDYVILAITASLIGLILAIRPEPSEVTDGQETRTLFGGLVSFLAVGCPVCNQLVVALVGTSGALSWWAPVQPVVGLLAIGLLLWTLKLRLETYRLTACPLPEPTASGR